MSLCLDAGTSTGGGAGAAFRQQIQRVRAVRERGHIQCGQWRCGWRFPGRDVRVGQAARGSAGDLVDTVPRLGGAPAWRPPRRGRQRGTRARTGSWPALGDHIGQPRLHIGQGPPVAGGHEVSGPPPSRTTTRQRRPTARPRARSQRRSGSPRARRSPDNPVNRRARGTVPRAPPRFRQPSFGWSASRFTVRAAEPGGERHVPGHAAGGHLAVH
ncbi:MAG: hypothetical protein QOE61_2890 [Micromonosporaceae bacterium]|nr:hypothetical protein [Micromonosporaceae bacterium]